jgi:hypothetical protein
VHSYGRDFRHTHYIHLGLAAIAYGAYQLVDHVPLAAYLPIPSFFALLALAEFGFDRWAWRLLALVPDLNIVDLSGGYAVDLREHAQTTRA